MIYTETTAIIMLQQNLDDGRRTICSGYFFDKNRWIAFDNQSSDCWVEEFKSEDMAICWVNRLFEISEIDTFEVLRLNDNLLFVPTLGYLNYTSAEGVFISKFYPINQQ